MIIPTDFYSPSLIEMGGLDELSAYVIMPEGLMAPQAIHGISGVAELSYGRSPYRNVDGHAYVVSSDGGVSDGGLWNVTNSYGTLRDLIMILMHITLIMKVILVLIARLLHIPTEISPGLNTPYDTGYKAYYVDSAGNNYRELLNNYDDSYGSSPSIVYDITGACYIIATGSPTDVGYSIPNSYGKDYLSRPYF